MNTRRGMSLSLLLVGALLLVLVAVPPLVQAMREQPRTANHAPAVLTPPAEEPTSPPGEDPTSPPGEDPTSPPGEDPTSPPGEDPTSPPGEDPTSPPGEDPTSPPGEDPTSPPGEDPTSPPVEDPTAPPSGGGGGGGGSPREGNVAIAKSMDRGEVGIGDTVDFLLTVTNEDGRSDNVVVRDTLHACFSIVNATTSWGDLTREGNTVVVTIERLFDEDVVTIHILARLTCQPGEGEASNTATVSSTSDDDEEEDNVSSVMFQVGETATPTLPPTDTPTPLVTPSPTMTSTPPPSRPNVLPRTSITNGNTECHAARMVCEALDQFREQVRDVTRDRPDQGEHRRSPVNP